MPDKRETWLIPPEGRKDVGKHVFAVLNTIIEDKQQLGLHKKWNENYRLWKNEHWRAKSSSKLPLTTANLIYTHVERTKNELTDNNPTFNVAQIGQVDEAKKQFGLDLQHTTEHWWIEQEQQDALESSVLNGEMYGITIEKVVFNPDLEIGLGEVETEIVDPFYFGWYPLDLKNPKDINNPRKCEAVVHFYPMPIRYLCEKYPDKANKIKADMDIIAELHDDRRDIGMHKEKGEGSNISIGGAIKNIVNFFSGHGEGLLEEETVVCEMWLRDRSKIYVGDPYEDEDGKIVRDSQPKYTGEIRYIRACSGEVVLEDKDNPNINPNLPPEEAEKTYLYDKFPFVAVNSVKDTASAWGSSDIEQIEWLQRELDKSLSQMILEKDRMIRAKLINPMDSGVENEELTNYISVVRPSSQMTAQGLRWLIPPAPTGDVQSAIEIIKSLLLMIAGTFDLDSAQQGKNVIAYKAIAALLERAATMKRGKIRNYGRLIRERGRMYLSHVMNFYTEERWITYKDPSGEEAVKPVVGTEMIIPAKLTVVSGSTLPISRVQQREEAIELWRERAIDQPELLERLDISNRAEIVKRMQAGPLGAAFEALTKVGVPPEFLEYFRGIAEADPKKLDQALKTGQMPSFPEFVKQIMAEKGGMPQEQPDPEVMKAQAEVKKIEAEAALTAAKIQTEAIEQQVKLAGIQFDKENLTMQRAKAVQEMENNIRSHDREDIKTGAQIVSSLNNRPGYNEQGGKSNNAHTE